MAKNSYRASFTKRFIEMMVKRKNPDDMIAEAKSGNLEKTLGVFDIIILGIGAIIGSGIFAVVGIAAAGGPESVGAGPALVLSMIIAAIACVFSALCYSEFASMIPVAGGAYIYTYATLGEFLAWMVGWILMLEYAIGYIAVACSWANHFMQFLKGFESVLPSFIVNPPIWLVNDFRTAQSIIANDGLSQSVIPTFMGIPICFNLPAILIIAVITAILVRGTKQSAQMAGVMVFIKLAVIALFVLVGAFYVKPENWTPFIPNGFDGVFMGAFIIFFAYIGFDALATTAEECKNPQRDLPIGIIGSLIITTLIYISVALVLTGIQPTSGVDIPLEFLKAPMVYVMSSVGQNWVAGLISIGALAGLTSVLLVLQLAATRILFAMSRDNFLPTVCQKVHPKFRTPHILTIALGVVCMLGTLFLDLNAAAQLCNFGTFTSFIVVCVAVLILRKTDPDRPRPFKVPFSPLFPLLGILLCGGLMVYFMVILNNSSGVSSDLLIIQLIRNPNFLFVAWLGVGGLIYLHYGYKKNRVVEVFDKRKKTLEERKQNNNEQQ